MFAGFQKLYPPPPLIALNSQSAKTDASVKTEFLVLIWKPRFIGTKQRNDADLFWWAKKRGTENV